MTPCFGWILPHPLEPNIEQKTSPNELIQYYRIVQLKHSSLITQNLKEIHCSHETGLIDTINREFIFIAWEFTIWLKNNNFHFPEFFPDHGDPAPDKCLSKCIKLYFIPEKKNN